MDDLHDPDSVVVGQNDDNPYRRKRQLFTFVGRKSSNSSGKGGNIEEVPEQSIGAAQRSPPPLRRLSSSDWCAEGKLSAGNHTLPRGTTCTLTLQVVVSGGTSLSLASASAAGGGGGAAADRAIISGGGTTRIFYVIGDQLVWMDRDFTTGVQRPHLLFLHKAILDRR